MPKMGKRILITDAGGFLGKALVNRLLQTEDVEILATCYRSRDCYAFPEHRRLAVSPADLENPGDFESLFTEWKPETVFHLGAVARLHAGQENPERAVVVNLIGSIELVELSARFGVKKFLFTSSDLAREAKSVVGITKLLMEYYLQLFSEKNPEVVVFRMPNLYDFPGSVMDIFARQIAENKDLSITDERMARRFITREEAVDYLLFLLENGKKHQVYSVKQEPIRIKDIALKMIGKSGKDLRLRIIGTRPGEKIVQASYPDEEVESLNFKNIARLRLSSPTMDEIFFAIGRCPVPDSLKTILQKKFETLLTSDGFPKNKKL